MSKKKFKKNVSSQVVEEKVVSGRGYPSDYKPKSIVEQIELLHKFFPALNVAEERTFQNPLPAGAEAFFAIPRWEKIAPNYDEAVLKVLALIAETRKDKDTFINFRENKMGLQYLRQTANDTIALQKIGDQQKKHDILVVPAQFGLRHKSVSVEQANQNMKRKEFGLDAFAIAIMLLTHPERLQKDALGIKCPGDDYNLDDDKKFIGTASPFFAYDSELLHHEIAFGACYTESRGPDLGSASGFLM